MSEEQSAGKPRFGNTTRGMFWAVVSGLLFVGVTGTVRHLGSDMNAIQSAFIRYVFGTLLFLPLYWQLLQRSPPILPLLAQTTSYPMAFHLPRPILASNTLTWNKADRRLVLVTTLPNTDSSVSSPTLPT